MPTSYTPPDAEDQDPGDIFRGFEGLSPLGIALILASRGVAIFPCEPGSKSPATPHGFKDATADISLYDHPKLPGYVQGSGPDGSELFLADRRDNWGIEPGQAGLFVVDIDPKNGGDETWAEFEKRHGPVATLEVLTPSGGRHLYFRGTVPFVNKRLGRGIDTRCFGGYVILPGGRIYGKPQSYTLIEGQIAPLPAWIAEEIEAQIEEIAAGAGQAAFENWQEDEGEGSRFDFYLSLIGDHEGGQSFYEPLTRAAGMGVALEMPADAILDRLQETAFHADRRNHSLAEVRDRLSKMPAAIRAFQAKDAQRRREAEEQEDVEPSDEPEDDEFDPGEPATGEDDPEEPDEQPRQDDPQAGYAAHEAAVAAAKTRLGEELRAILDSPDPDKGLIKAAMGVGKTTTTFELLAELTDPSNPRPVLRFEREDQDLEEELDPEKLLRKDFSKLDAMPAELGQVVYAAHRHDLLKASAEILKEALRRRGWSEEDIEENVVILSGRARDTSTCLRPAEAKMISDAGGSVSDSLCFKRATATQPAVVCPFYEECQWQKTKRRAARARFVFMTHAHLCSPFGPPGLPGHFHPQNADLIVIDEDPIATMIDEDPTRIPARSFQALLPEEHNGNLIEEALTKPDTLDFLRAQGITPDKLLKAAEYRKNREHRHRIGHPKMNLAERKAEHDRQQKRKPRPPKLSGPLECLAAEVQSGRSGGSYALQHDPQTGDTLFRARQPMWNTSRQKVIVLDGTANVEELRRAIPGIKEVLINVPRNAVFIQVYSEPYSKRSLLQKGKPTRLLEETVEFAERCAKMLPRDEKGRPRTALFTRKEIRAVLTQASQLPVAEEFRSALLGHYGNVRGANDWEHCALGVLIGDSQRPTDINEAAAFAWNFDSPRNLQRITPNARGKKSLARRPADYLVKPGVKIPAAAKRATISFHPDPAIQRRSEATSKHEQLQTLDRPRLVHNRDPKLVFLFTPIPLLPVDMLVSAAEVDDCRLLFQLIEEAGALGWQNCISLRPGWLHETFPWIFRSAKVAEHWGTEVRNSQTCKIAEQVWKIADRERGECPREPSSILTNRQTGSHPSLIYSQAWTFAECHAAGSKASEWSLFMYRGGRPSRYALAAQVGAQPVDLSLRTLDGQPLAALEDTGPVTGDALLDQTLGWCAAQGVALPLAPKALADLAGSPWPNAQAVKDWKKGKAAAKILARGPPEGWSAAEYRLTGRRGGKPDLAWIPPGADPRTATAAALGKPVDAVVLKAETNARPTGPEPEPLAEPTLHSAPELEVSPTSHTMEQSEPSTKPDLEPQRAGDPAKPPWSAPPQPEFILETPSRRCTWHLVDRRADRRNKPLNFSTMLQDDPDEGRLLTAADLSFTPDEPLRWLTGLLLRRGIISGKAGERVYPEPL